MTDTILTLTAEFMLPAIPSFVTSEKFCEGKTIDDITVAWTGDHFKKHLLEILEGPVDAEMLREYELRKTVSDPDILPLLESAEKARIGLGQYWEILKTKDRKFRYAAYVRGKDEKIFGVHACWMPAGLHVESGDLNRSHGWGIRLHFISH
jgi:hypothetical protein